MERQFVFAIVNEVLQDAPVWNRVEHGVKNWAIAHLADRDGFVDPLGLDVAKYPGRYKVPPELAPGVAVEFGTQTYNGRKREERWYGYVVAITPGALTLARCNDLDAALAAAARYRAAGAPDSLKVGRVTEVRLLMERYGLTVADLVAVAGSK